MARQKDIKDEITQIVSLKELVEIYGQIASIRMKKIRDSVLKNRDFVNAINDIFNDALRAYTRKQLMMGKTKGGGKVTFLSHNGKTVVVFISANTGFYGEVVQTVFKRFVEDVRKDQELEVTIIGRLGRSLFSQTEPGRAYTFFDSPDFGVDREKLAEIVKHLVQYEQIKVYYGKYKTVVSQITAVEDMSAGTKIEQKGVSSGSEYIFEPKVEDILMFFETEIFASFFDQSIRESQLAKLASRIVSMDKATENIKDNLKIMNNKRLKLIHDDQAKKQLGLISTVINI